MVRRLALLLFALIPMPTPAQDDGSRPVGIEVFPPVPDVGTGIRVTLQGEWRDACTPTLERAEVIGRDIVLHGRVAASGCSGGARPFRITSETLPRAALKVTAAGVNRVRFEIDRGQGPELHGFRLLYVGSDPDPGFVPETGFWWPERGGEFDNAGPGLGVQMEVQGRTLSVGAFGYDGDGGSGWYFGAGSLERRSARIELSRLRGGAGPFVPYRAPGAAEAVGELHVELISPSRATLWFLQSLGGSRGWSRQPVSMVRFRFAQEAAEAWLGRWVVLAESDSPFLTRRIDFVTVTRREGGFVLSDADARTRLDCDLALTHPNSPPTRCRLSAAGEAHPEVDFDAVALNELRGWSALSQRVVALKLQR